jgi:hypothetical protein
MGDKLQAGQTQEAARAFDGVNQPENAVQSGTVGGIGFKHHKLIVNRFQKLIRLCYEFRKQLVHHVNLLPSLQKRNNPELSIG